ncbi:MAG: NAD(P)-dependent oxidoreductase [Verrucomicrobia bacterium]|nr:NAD(P)-dependent oxidoreductase [Verrucomicrobiota bacterium]
MPLRSRLDAATAARNMSEIEPRYRDQEAKVEANRCLYCFDAPCINSCPTGIDIPAFIKGIADDNLVGAARTILQANVLGASCARVCPTEVLCEGACVMLDRDAQPIKIGRLQRYATDHVYDHGIPVLHAAAEKSGKRVALIGGGPASLACAAELAQLGHEAVIFEKKPHAGGLNTYGIAYYKLTPAVSLAEVELVKSLGVDIRTGVEVGKDITVAELEKAYDAIFLGVGLGQTYSLDIPGESLPEVVEALTFIEELHVKPLHNVAVGKRVAVIGCGNTAIDAVTQAKRLGAQEAVIIYRRGEDDMPAYPYEYDLAKHDGAAFLFHTVPVAVLGDDHVTGLRLARTAVSAQGKLEIIADSEFDEPFDMVIKALGQEKMADMLHRLFPALALESNGAIKRDFTSGQTMVATVFAGGDGSSGGAEVVDAVAEGKRAARGMHRLFTGDNIEGPTQTTRLGAPGKASGAGFDKPVRVPELEKAFFERRAT